VSCTKSENEHTRFFDGLRYHIENAIDNANGDIVLAIDTEQSIQSMKNPQRYNFEIDLLLNELVTPNYFHGCHLD